MTQKTTPIPKGWKGGFAQSNPAFSYPNPDLSSLPMLDNMDNINLLTRQEPVHWPEFSWVTIQGEPTTRCFQMFAPYISRIGYTNAGRVYSIICPQQGIYVPKVGYLNVEVTVTGQRGWVDETAKNLAADMTVVGKVWFSPSAHKSSWGDIFLKFLTNSAHPFPTSKANAIEVFTHKEGDPLQPIFPVRKGVSTLFTSPDFAQHSEAWMVGHIDVQIGSIKKTGNDLVDEFNVLVMALFNVASGNMLQKNNILSWNLYFNQPALVNRREWRTHAERWRKSIDEDHGSPDGNASTAKYADGKPFSVEETVIEEAIEAIEKWAKNNTKNGILKSLGNWFTNIL